MNTLTYSEVLTLVPEDNYRLFALCGKLNEHLKMIEKRLGVLIRQRGYTFSILGEERAVKKAYHAIDGLYHQTAQVLLFEPKDIHMYLKGNVDDVVVVDEQQHQYQQSMDIRLKNSSIVARGLRTALRFSTVAQRVRSGGYCECH